MSDRLARFRQLSFSVKLQLAKNAGQLGNRVSKASNQNGIFFVGQSWKMDRYVGARINQTGKGIKNATR